MTLSEMRDLLDEVSAIDNRKVTPETVQAWHDVCGHVTFTVARRAVILARRDASVQYLEPRHVMGKIAVAAAELNDEERSRQISPEDSWKSEHIPVCAEHNLRITKCQDCIVRLMTEAGNLYGTQLHEWAIANIYRADSIV